MTTKDIRDIAAYMWATYTVECLLTPFSHDYHDYLVENNLPFDTQENFWIEIKNKLNHEGPLLPFRFCEFRNFKLQLRPIARLTDDEKWHCAQLAGHEHRDTHYFIISDENDLLFYDLSSPYISPVYNPGAIVAYLQSIGVYVPGSIDEKYVDLVE